MTLSFMCAFMAGLALALLIGFAVEYVRHGYRDAEGYKITFACAALMLSIWGAVVAGVNAS